MNTTIQPLKTTFNQVLDGNRIKNELKLGMGGKVNKNVIFVFAINETIAFFVIKPFYLTIHRPHLLLFLFYN